MVTRAKDNMSLRSHFHNSPKRQQRQTHSIISQLSQLHSWVLKKTADDGNISIFTKEGVSVYKEEDVLITCKGEAILIGKRDERGRYWIPLVQNRGNWQPKRPTKHSKKYLQQANSVYDLPSTEEATKWMHAVCGYPVKSIWLKAVKAGNHISWSLLTEQDVNKYYPKTTETPKGCMNQTRKNVQSTKSKPTTWEQPS